MSWQQKSHMPSAFQSYKPKHMRVYGCILVNEFGEVLLVHGRLSKKWSFPKGHCKYNETDIECAKRELWEETGLSVDGNYVCVHKMRGGTYFVFTIEGHPPLLCKDNWEIDDMDWWPIHNLPTEDCNVDVSIFRSLMKNCKPRHEGTINYIDSTEAKKNLENIKRNINQSTSSNSQFP